MEAEVVKGGDVSRRPFSSATARYRFSMRNDIADRLARSARAFGPTTVFPTARGDTIEYFRKYPLEEGALDAYLLTLGPGLSYHRCSYTSQQHDCLIGMRVDGHPFKLSFNLSDRPVVNYIEGVEISPWYPGQAHLYQITTMALLVPPATRAIFAFLIMSRDFMQDIAAGTGLPEDLRPGSKPAADEPWLLEAEIPSGVFQNLALIEGCPLRGGLRRLYIEGKSLELIALLLPRMIRGGTETDVESLRPRTIRRIHEARDIIVSRLDDLLSLAMLAEAVGMSTTGLTTAYRRVFGHSVFGHARNERLKRARAMLAEGSLSVGEIACLVGYRSQSAFTVAFKKQFRTMPREVWHKGGGISDPSGDSPFMGTVSGRQQVVGGRQSHAAIPEYVSGRLVLHRRDSRGGSMGDFTMTIGGRPVRGESFAPVINPVTGEPFEDAPECTLAQLDQAMENAQRAFGPWSRDEQKRRQVLHACARVLEGTIEVLAETLTREQGKPLDNARDEIKWAAAFLEACAGATIPIDLLKDDQMERIEVLRRPFGVVVGIIPWNFPVLIACWKIGQALVTGNTMVLKPSPTTPLSTLKMGEFLRGALPPGVLNIVSGSSELGAAMTAHAATRKISFTGSVATGKKIAQATAPDLKHVTLELGGNDPAIVLKDVDVPKMFEKLFWSAFYNCGQSCIAIKRLYVHESVFPSATAALAEAARRVKVGDGLLPDVQIGPLNNKMQFERVASLVEDAKQKGGRIAAGGNPRSGQGYFFEPTIVTDIDSGARLVDEEQFGPALPIMPYRDVDEAIERANATHYGLGGSI